MELQFKGVNIQEFYIRDANKLLLVQIDIDYQYGSQEGGVRLSSLLNSLHHCTKLILSSWCIQVTVWLISHLAIYFLYITCLTCYHVGWNYLLKCIDCDS